MKSAVSKILLSLLLVVSAILPYTAAVKAAETMTVAEAIANNSGTATVKGYIVGTASSKTSYDQTAPFTAATNIGLADSPDETDPAKIMPVQLPSGAIRAALNLVDHPELFKAEVTITGSLEAYFSTAGLKSPTAYTIIGDVGNPPDEPEAKVVETLAEARAVTGDVIQIEGTVTTGLGYWGGKAFYIQDETAGLYVYGSSWPVDVKQGDNVRLTGQVSEYATELQIQPTSLEVISSGNELPKAQMIDAAGVSEDTQGELVTVENATITDLQPSGTYGTFEFKATDADGKSILVRHDNRSGSSYDDFVLSFKEGDFVHVTGIAAKYNDVYQLKPRGLEDYDLVNKPAVYTDVFPGNVGENTKVSLKSGWENAKIYYTTDGSTPTASSTRYTEAITLTKDTVIKAIAVNDTTSSVFTFDYTVMKTEELKIRDIQGMDHFTPYEGQLVSDVEGVVTYVLDANNFYMQDPNPDNDITTSEAILVYNKAHGLQSGDHVSVEGKVTEWYIEGYAEMKTTDLPTTELTNTTITKLGTLPVPEALVIGVDVIPPSEVIDNDLLKDFNPNEDGIDFWESLEGMLISVPNAHVVGPQKYGEVIVVAENAPNTAFHKQGGILISEKDYNPEKITIDFNNESFVAKAGDSFNGDIIGPVSYGFGNYKLLTSTRNLPALVEGDTAPETTWIEKDEDKLSVATYNIENFSANKSQTSDTKAQRIAKSFVDNMKSPDIIALVEVQDNDGATDSGSSDASESYQRLISEIKAAGGPDYQFTDIAPEYNQDGGQPGGNIQVGFLYNPKRVTLAEGTKGTAMQANEWDEKGELTLNPGRIQPSEHPNTRKPVAAQFEFNGEKVVVIAAHMNSKSGDQPLFGQTQPPVLESEAERIELAKIMNDFIKQGQQKDPDLNVIVAGDMNDFEFTPALTALKGEILTNMVEEVPLEDRFSYFYQGNSQVLDHILVTNNLKDKTEVDMIHINSMFMEEHGRASDHDPVLIQTDISGEPAVEPIVPERVYNFKNFKTKKLTISKPSVSITLDEASVMTEGILFTGAYAEFHGSGFAKTKVAIKPAKAGAIIDFKGTEMTEVIIDGNNVKEIRDAENIQTIKYENGANADTITWTKGK